MTRQQIIDIALSGLGNGYKWGYGLWNVDGSEHTSCSRKDCTGCTCIKREDDMCTNWYLDGGKGADCSGYVAKCWQVPGPTAIETNSHPYGTGAFHDNFTHWTAIERSELKPGDALVYRNEKDTGGHIVLFDSDTGTKDAKERPNYMVYEAKGCNDGVVHDLKAMDSTYIAIRRNAVTDFECKEDTCNHHGTCSTDSGCACNSGYEGKFCERCELGFVGYPSCVRSDTMCQLSGTISCEMKPMRLTPQQGSMAMSNYACGSNGLDGGELAFRFDPARAGKATISIEGSSDPATRVLLLRGACAPEGCVKADARSLEFDFGGGEVFFVAVDTKSGAAGDVTLKVDCKRDEQAWIGDPCNDASDCNFSQSAQHGFCYDTGSGGFCSLPCTKFCPDLPANKAATFCIADPARASAGICVPKADAINQRCAALPGTAAKTATRFNDTASAEACVPGATAPACSGGFVGRVVDATSNKPLANARVAVEGGAAMMLQTDADGQYKTASMPCGQYTLRISADGFAPVNAGVQVTGGNVTQMTALRAVSMAACAATGSVRGLIFDAVTKERKPIPDATIALRAGVGQGIGPISFEITAGSDGMFLATGLAAGTYTIAATAPGYQSATATIGVCGGSEPQVQDIGLATAMQVPFRAILRWNKPKDLDLHLQTPQGDEVYFYEPCRGGLERAPFARLDVDRRNAEGPEIISVASFLPGRYTVFVHNYSAQTQNDPTTFAESGAEVVVYGTGDRELGRFAVPVGGSGMSWDVFSFDGSDPDRITSIQQLTQRPDPETEYSEDCRP
jgi:hypothetical protein